jgi:UDP-glucose 4-epimerase
MDRSGQHVLVTGGAGFVGRALVRRLLADGAEVTVVDAAPIHDRRVRQVEGDLEQTATVDRAMDAPVTGVVHLAAQTSVLASMSRPVEVHRANVDLTLALLERCRARGVKSFVLASTNAVVGDAGHDLIDERSPMRPLTPYGATKAAAEMLLSAYSGSYGISGSAVRLTNVYGPGMEVKDSLVARFMRACLFGSAVSIYGDGEQVRDYLYVDDAVQGLLLAHDVGLVGPLTIGSGVSISVNDLRQLVESVTGVPLPAPHVEARPGEMPAVRVRIDTARRLGFRPARSLAEGLLATWEDFRREAGRAAEIGNNQARRAEE